MKKIFALALAMMLCAACLSACSDKTTTTTQATEAPAATVQVTVAPAENAAATEAPIENAMDNVSENTGMTETTTETITAN